MHTDTKPTRKSNKLQFLLSGPLRVMTLLIPQCCFTSCGDDNLVAARTRVFARIHVIGLHVHV